MVTSKINFVKKIFILSSAIFLFSCTDQSPKTGMLSSPPPVPFTTDGKQVIVYTTADSSDLRLTLTDPAGTNLAACATM